MSRHDSDNPALEQVAIRLHVTKLFRDLGIGAITRGIELIVVPASTDEDIWAAETERLLRALRNGEPTDEQDITAFLEIEGFPAEETIARTLGNSGLDAYRGQSALMLVFAKPDDPELTHESMVFADRTTILDVLDAALLKDAALICGRVISAKDAEMLATMPWRRRKLAFLARRSIAESYEIHRKAEAEVAEKPKVKRKTSRAAAERKVPEGLGLGDLHGYGAAKSWGMDVVRDVQDYEFGNIGWQDVDAGVLLSGPPGTGKTTFARALAVTAQCHFVAGSYSQWQAAGHQGDMLKAMRESFEEAKRHAPSVLLIDEIDGFVARGSGGQSDDYLRGVVNGLLELLDGSFDLTGVVVVGATNHAEIVDPAIRRSGRLDRHIRIELPDAEARLAILAQHLGVGEDFPLNLFARRTEGMSGADLEKLARDARRFARRDRDALKHHHVARAFPRRERRSDDDLRHIAIHEIGHAVVAVATGATVHEVFASRDFDPEAGSRIAGVAMIEPRGGRRNFAWYADRVAQMLGGMAAEKLVYGDHSDGVLLDLAEAANVMTYALSSVGLGESIVSDGNRNSEALARARQTDAVLRRRVEEALREQAERARALLEDNREAFQELVERLAERCHLDGKEVHDVINAHTPAGATPLVLSV